MIISFLMPQTLTCCSNLKKMSSLAVTVALSFAITFIFFLLVFIGTSNGSWATTGVRNWPNINSSLGSTYSSLHNCLYFLRTNNFMQVPGMESNILHGISRPPYTQGELLQCILMSLAWMFAPRSIMSFAIRQTSRENVLLFYHCHLQF